MLFYVTIGAATFEVELDGDTARVNGRELKVELLQVGATPVHRLSVAGESYRLVAESGDARGDWALHLDGRRINAEVVDERTRAIRALTARTAAPQGPKPVRAPMPGMVVRVEVSPGDRVKAGQGVIIIEAMKMENELKAEAAGVVARVGVAAGTAVEKGAILIEFAADD